MKAQKANNLIRVIIKIIAYLSKPVSIWEKRIIKKYGRKPLKHSPVFIIGAPRTGSTILYQVITNIFDVLYIDNLVCRFKNNLLYGFWLSKRLTKHKAHNSQNSYHGNTENSGLRAPSECGKFWYRWLPKDHHFIDYDEITEKMVKEIKENITAVSNYFEKPIVFKNLNAGQRIRLLSQCFPDAKYIYIKRDPLLTAQSIYKSRIKLSVPDNTIWSILPKNYKELEKLELPELIVKQIYYLEKQISDDLKMIEDKNIYVVNYNELNKEHVFDEIKEFINVGYRRDAKKLDIKINNELKLNADIKEAFEKVIDHLDWRNYQDE